MQKGDTIRTPRFLNVEISNVLSNAEAHTQGFTEPTHYYDSPGYDIYGKHTGVNRMIFAAVEKN